MSLCVPGNIEAQSQLRSARAESEEARIGKLVADVKECGKRNDLQRGKLLHHHAIRTGCHNNRYVAHTLISMYSKCNSMHDAYDVFESMSRHDVVSWTALIFGYVENGEYWMSLYMFCCMSCVPNRITLFAALRACLADEHTCLQRGMAIHRRARVHGLDKDVFVANTLVIMYRKCYRMHDARVVFDNMVEHDVVSWNCLIAGYVEAGDCVVALGMFASMDCRPDSFTFAAALNACASLATNKHVDKDACLEKGMAIHRRAREDGFDKDIFVTNTLVDMYSKCGSMRDAHSVFEKMVLRDVVSWNSLMLGYIENEEYMAALNLFVVMECVADDITFVAALKACAGLGELDMGQRIHNGICKTSLEHDKMLATCLVAFYGKCGKMDAAEEVFNRMCCRDIVSWTALLGGYSLLGDTSQAFRTVKRMQEAGVQMNNVTVLMILTACSRTGKVEEGLRWFESMPRYGMHATVEHYTCMVEMLGRVNRLQEALSLVNSMPFKGDSVVWMTLLEACTKWNNLQVGKVAFRASLSRIENEEDVAAAYVMMENIYKRLGMVQKGEQIYTESYIRSPYRCGV